MRKLLLISFVLGLLSCKGQKENTEEPRLADRVVNYYNGENYDSIFYLLSQSMKEQLPLDQTRAFFTQLRKDAGKIEDIERISNKGLTVRYRAQFQNVFLWMDLSPNKYGKIDGLMFTPYDGPLDTSASKRNQTKMALPFTGEWFVFWGGVTREQNYHVISPAQRHAFDLLIMDSTGRSFRTDGKKNEDYYAFGQPLMAPCKAKVVAVIDGVRDNVPGVMNPDQLTGNTVVLLTSSNEYILLAHFKLNSIKVKTGDIVSKGQFLGLCGNSGNSSEPHLHFHLQDREKMEGAKGIKCFFEALLVNGNERTDYSPVKGERIKTR